MKVFVVTGTQLPFDRLVRTVDEWAGANPHHEVFGQIGPATYVPRHMGHSAFLDPPDFARRSREADVHVTHAGTGSIFSALEMRKVLFVLPRRHALGEHRNDHQLATVDHLGRLPGLNVAGDEVELRGMLDRLDEVEYPRAAFPPVASPRLLETLREFIDETPGRARASAEPRVSAEPRPASPGTAVRRPWTWRPGLLATRRTPSP